MRATMAKGKEESSDGVSGRKKVKYIALPVDVWERLKRYADADDRSINRVAKRLILDGLDKYASEGGNQ